MFANLMKTIQFVTLRLRFGDNDTLGAITAGMINADYLFS
jgi:glutamate 5-kinase